MYEKPEDLWLAAWRLLTRANNDRKHAFRTASVSSVRPDGTPNARTVVMRKADREAGTIRLYTDLRSGKMTDLEAGAQLHWLLWDPKKQLQFGASGTVKRLERGRELERFAQLPKHGRKAYATLNGPGTSLTENTDGLPPNWEAMDESETDYAAANFCVLETVLERAEVLSLDRAQGHRRIRATKDETGNWALKWIVP
jgi:pyridoxine/pyridoxamine 5'-phosphate oxidase